MPEDVKARYSLCSKLDGSSSESDYSGLSCGLVKLPSEMDHGKLLCLSY
jgi:hypothetical protein